MKKVLRNILFAGVIISICAAIPALIPNHADARQAVIVGDVSIASKYAVGEVIDIPHVQLQYNQKSYEALSVVVFPSGLTKGATKIQLSEAGKYSLFFRALADNGTAIESKKEFLALNQLYSVSGQASTISYGSSARYAPDRNGIVLSLANGETFQYNKIVDLNNFTDEQPVISLFHTPETIGVADTRQLRVTFTDAYDPSNSVTVVSHKVTANSSDSAWAERNTYTTAAANGQTQTGIESWDAGKLVTWRGRTYKLHQNDGYGASINYSFPGTPSFPSVDEANTGKQTYSLSWDYNERILYKTGNVPIIDLDEPLFFNSLWEGFSSSKVFISISASAYQTRALNLVITDIGGLKADELAVNKLIVDKGPEVNVQIGEYTQETLPFAREGIPYRVFGATAFDDYDQETAVSLRVYYNYGLSSQALVPVRGGEFVPLNAGKYTLLYTAVNSAGVSTSVPLEVDCLREGDGLTVNVADFEPLAAVGTVATVGLAEVNNASGKSWIEITAVNLTDSSVSYNIPTSGAGAYTFRPMQTGNYSIVYKYGDYIQSKSVAKNLTVESSNKPIIIDEAVLPRYLIKGSRYLMPQINGYTFVDGKARAEAAKISFSENSGSAQALSGAYYTPSAAGTARITYSLIQGVQQATKYYDIPVIDTGYGGEIDMSKYFVQNAFSVDRQQNKIAFTTAQNNSSLKFINSVLTTDFLFGFQMDSGSSQVDVYLIDIVDPSVQLKLSYISRNDGKKDFAINDKTVALINAQYTAYNTLRFYNETLTVEGATQQSFRIDKDSAGRSFGGFDTRFAYMEVVISGVTSSAKIEVSTINNHAFSNRTADNISPTISRRVASGEHPSGIQTIIKATFAGDVLDPDLNFTMSVTAPDGSVVRSIDGVLLDATANPSIDHTIVLEQYGRYTVSYRATDTSGRSVPYNYNYIVVDTEPPVITIDGGVTSGKVGATIKIASAVATDNYSQVKLFTYLTRPDGVVQSLKTNSFVAGVSGVYTLSYYAFDERGNTTVKSYDITISEK